MCTVCTTAVSVLRYHEVMDTPPPIMSEADLQDHHRQTAKQEAFITDIETDKKTGETLQFKRLRATGIFKDCNQLAVLIVGIMSLTLYSGHGPASNAAWYGRCRCWCF